MKITRVFDLSELKNRALTQVDRALAAADDAVQEAILAGQYLNEVKAGLDHGEFIPWIEKNCSVGIRSVQGWMAIAREMPAHALKGDRRFQITDAGTIEVDGRTVTVDVLLSAPDEDLTETMRDGRQLLMDFTANKTIRQCLAGIVVEGDEPHRLKRAANGRNARQTRGEDRKDWPLFALNKLKDLDAHLSHWDSMTESQRTELKAVVRAAVIGDSVTLAKRPGATRTFEAWPKELVMVLAETCRELLR